jgi:5'-nucleotidase/UDP-sugar diphosphatase
MKRTASFVFGLLLLALSALPLAAQGGSSTVTLISFSDYHSHAVPFYSEGKPNQAGIARAIAYLKEAKAKPNTLVISGGDTMNLGIPTWSDEYKCVEWPWFNGLVDVMALGNHDFDYGAAEFERCRGTINYPIISANLAMTDGKPLLQVDGKPYVIKELGGVKVGFFSVGGPDVQRLIRKEWLPAGATWKEAIATAKEIVDTLRNTEKVNAVVFIGHQLREDDEAMAKAVPGIDLILGTHSHYKGNLNKIAGTETYYISPFQYLTYLAKVDLTFDGGKLSKVNGELVKMDETRPEDKQVADQVAQLQKDLAAKRPERFEVLGKAQIELSDANLSMGESLLGNWATEVLRQAAGTHAFFSTASSFRASIPPGDITVESFYTAIPYKNTITTAQMTGQQLADLIAMSVRKMDSDGFSQQSGVRYAVQDGKPINIQVLKNLANPAEGYLPLDLNAPYQIGTTDFQATIAGDYKDLFAKAQNLTKTDKDAHQALIAAIKAGPITASLDNRTNNVSAPAAQAATSTPAPAATAAMTSTVSAAPVMTATVAAETMPAPAATSSAPTTLPTTGQHDESPLALLVAGIIALLSGLALWQRRPATG